MVLPRDVDPISRRRFIATGALAAGSFALAPGFLRDALAAPAKAGAGPYGPLLAPNANALMLPSGFRSRLVARGLEFVPGTTYQLPVFPDGQATFQTRNGGWILVTNAESLAGSGAGASAIRFAPDGAIQSAYRILGGTDANCAGGPTPFGTWLSCEEVADGMVWECDPAGVLAAEARPALGLFKHEAAAVDPIGGRLYLTEDEGDGGFYRFTPSVYPSLRTGRLEVAVVSSSGSVSWQTVPDPSTAETGTATRRQVPAMTRFNGGEGIWYARGVLYFTTKGDKKVWAYDAGSEQLEILYDRTLAPDASLDAVDNVTVSSAGEVFVCEDGGNLEIGLISPERTVSPFLRFVGPDHQGSELCGVCFDPSGERMYFTSQRAFPVISGQGPGGIYEVTGPFRLAAGGAGSAFGPPAGETRPQGPLNPGRDTTAPRVSVSVARRVGRRSLVRRGLAVRVKSSEAAQVFVALRTPSLSRVAGRGTGSARPRSVRLAKARARVERGGTVRLKLRLGRGGRVRLRRRSGALRARVIVSVTDAAGNRRLVARVVRVGRAEQKSGQQRQS